MAWNESNNDNQDPNNPWRNKKPSKPPELDKLLKQLFSKMQTVLGFKKDNPFKKDALDKKHLPKVIVTIAIVVLLFWAFSGFFVVNPAERAVVLRFGRYQTTLDSGLQWIPPLIDTKYLIDVEKVESFNIEGDFLTMSSDLTSTKVSNAELRAVVPKDNAPGKGENLVYVEIKGQYHIDDPKNYLFAITSPHSTIIEAARGVLSEVIGTMTLDEVITKNREEVSARVFAGLEKVLQQYHTGLHIDAITLRKAEGPKEVSDAFNDVIRAGQERATFIQHAMAYRSKVIPEAQGKQARILADATAYQKQIVLKAKADVARFNALLSAYNAAPNVTSKRMYLDTITTLLQSSSKVLIDDTNNQNLIYLPLEKLIAKQGNKT